MPILKGIPTALAAVLFISACGSKPTPPTYPYPEPAPVEDTALGAYLDGEADQELEDDARDE
jgi:hypothetical protein